ncbi:MAG: zinc ribbon domain-containing protein [Elusimicrobia bacterium]|nr:zinc ribbon domain-containing protein [Elusimicrobiota bacterium]
MKCPNCATDNKDNAKACKKCARDLTVPPPWTPDWHWHGKVLGVIYAGLVVLYVGVSFVLRRLPEPYHIRKIPPEMTPWLKR